MSPAKSTGPADSAGVPWAGRTFSTTGFESDDGRADPRLAEALRAHRDGGDLPAVASALAGARLLVPVVAVLTEAEEATATGLQADAGAEMALVTLRAPDGRTALPAFTSVAALVAWDPAARPVPVEARRAALSAVDEGCSLLVLDPAGPVTAVLPRPALWALAQGQPWTPSPDDPQVHAAVVAASTGFGPVLAARCEPGERAELRVVLTVAAGLDRAALDQLTSAVSQRLSHSAVVADRVDSLELRVESGPPGP